MLYVIKSVGGRYLGSGNQGISATGKLRGMPVWHSWNGAAWGCSDVGFVQDVVKCLREDFGIESTVEEYK
jgi:hypothetical protein